tara:strand:+ start:42 stop:299 length:258 start_codon:yes stop_codon:yes gene_type:complete
MSIDKDKIQGRLDKLEADIKTIQQNIVDLERTKQERVAQLNATQGAKQQCQAFLREFEEKNNDEGGLPLVSDPKKDKLKDLGGLE